MININPIKTIETINYNTTIIDKLIITAIVVVLGWITYDTKLESDKVKHNKEKIRSTISKCLANKNSGHMNFPDFQDTNNTQKMVNMPFSIDENSTKNTLSLNFTGNNTQRYHPSIPAVSFSTTENSSIPSQYNGNPADLKLVYKKISENIVPYIQKECLSQDS